MPNVGYLTSNVYNASSNEAQNTNGSGAFHTQKTASLMLTFSLLVGVATSTML